MGILWYTFALIVVVVPVILAHVAVSFLGLSKLSAQLLTVPLGILGCCSAYYAYVRWVEKRALTEFSLRGALAELGFGAMLGIALSAGTMAVLAALGLYRITGVGLLHDTAVPFFSALGAAVVEEVVFRGVIFRLAEASLGTLIALLISAAVFGLIHMLNGNASLQGALAIILEAGVLLAAAFLTTRRLWFPIGIHFAWNFTLGGLFGVAVSGGRATGLLQGQLSGPAWLSGGSFGPEGSVVAVVLCATVGSVLLMKAWRKGAFVQPFWRARATPGVVPRISG